MKRKNILLVMADQFRADWMSCAGTDYVETPNIDRIAKRGVIFSKASCNSPLCAPSRASLASGLYPERVGVMDNDANYPLEAPTYYQLLRKNGYRVGVVGKTDLHKPIHQYGLNGNTPLMYHLGFTDPIDTEGKMNAAFIFEGADYESISAEKEREAVFFTPVGPYQKYLLERNKFQVFKMDYITRMTEKPIWYSGKSVLSKEDYHDWFIAKKSCDFIKNMDENSPWHLFVSFVGPHDPWDAPEKYLEKFKDKEYPDSIEDSSNEDKPEWIKRRINKHSKGIGEKDIQGVKQNYSGMISLIDDGIGKILDCLEEQNQLDNTIIIFTADHGEMMGDHGLFQKSVMYESALRVPFIVADPSSERQGIIDDVSMIELIDIAPTIMEMSSIDYIEKQFDGKSFVSLLSGEKRMHKRYQVSQLHNTHMIFDGRYKFIENKNDRNELYDLKEDKIEKNNLIDSHASIARELFQKLKDIAS